MYVQQSGDRQMRWNPTEYKTTNKACSMARW